MNIVYLIIFKSFFIFPKYFKSKYIIKIQNEIIQIKTIYTNIFSFIAGGSLL